MRKNIAPIMLLTLMAVSPMAMTNAHAQDAVTVPLAVPTVIQGNVFVSLNGLRARSTPDDAGKTMGILSLNEVVRVVSTDLINGKYVEIAMVGKPINSMMASEHYYVVAEYLSAKLIDYKELTGKYFVVVNVATETLRLYERQCLDNSCPSKMVMETEVVVGEDQDHPKEEKGKGRSILGSYRVTGIAKFYQDATGHYPAWYRDGYPDLPAPGDGFSKWLKSDIMPKDAEGKREGKMRGAFGWYAAFVAPNPYGQWTHGTVGWGEDHDEYIKKVKHAIMNIVSNPRSSGCTRNNNEAIAFIRQMIDVGTPIVKIYAKEALMDPALSNYRDETKPWQYVLTKVPAQKADRAEVLAALKLNGADVDAYWNTKRAGGSMIIDPKSPLNQILEVGTYNMDTQPTVIPYTPGEKMGKISRSIGRKGNVYGIKSADMSTGVFYIDAGVLSGYHHPKAVVEVSGFEDEETPVFMDARNLK